MFFKQFVMVFSSVLVFMAVASETQARQVGTPLGVHRAQLVQGKKSDFSLIKAKPQGLGQLVGTPIKIRGKRVGKFKWIRSAA